MRIRLFKGSLHYGPELVLHTASSGPVGGLEELVAALNDADGTLIALGGVRINIAYLSGIAPEALEAEALRAMTALDWTRPPEVLLEAIHEAGVWSAPVRALLDQTMHDALARRAGLSLHRLLATPTEGDGANPAAKISADTNQTLFWCDDDALLARAERYVERGFRKLKLRVGFGDLGDDVTRLTLLRERFGNDIRLSADANGHWAGAEAIHAVETLAAFDLDYLEQPVPATDWDALAGLARNAPMPIMLDESLATPADVERLAALGGRLSGHLKLVKCGGIRPLMATARHLLDAGIRVMVGQMNEGAIATAAIAHCAVALDTRGNELYGADGLIDDPADGLDYDAGDGRIHLPAGPGLGVSFDPSPLTCIWECEQ